MQHEVYVSTFEAADKPSATTFALTWDELCQVLTKHEVAETKTAPKLFNFCRFSTPYRADRNVVDVHALLLDLDDQPLDVVQALGARLAPLAYVSHSTWRHGLTPDRFRLRFAVRLSRPVLGTEWKAFARGVQAWLGRGPLDGCVVVASQSYYLPSRHPQRAALTHVQPGESLSVESILASVPAIAPEDAAPVPDTWRPAQIFTLEHLNKLPGVVAKRLCEGGKLALPGEKNHDNRRDLIYQFLCEYGPGEPDAALLQLLVNSAQASRETWISFFTSGSARAKAEAQHAKNELGRATLRAVDDNTRAMFDRLKAETAARVSSQVRQAHQVAGEVFNKESVQTWAKKCKDESVRRVLLGAVGEGEGVPDEYAPAIEKAGIWLARKELNKSPEVLKKPFAHMPADQMVRMYAAIDLGNAQINQSEKWRIGLHMTTDDKPSASEPNVRRILRLHSDLQGLWVWDVRQHAVRFTRSPPWPRVSADPFVSDADRGAISEWLVKEANIAVPFKTVGAALAALAQEMPRYDPIKAWLESLTWDGVSRLANWLAHYCGAADSRYTRAVGLVTLLGAVARAYQPGCKVDTVLVLEGPQGAKKSTLIKALCPVPQYFRDVDGVLRGDNKDLVMQVVCGSWIIELGELTGASRGDVHRTKAFLSRSDDSYRPPYAASVETFPRTTVFIATTNEGEYLSDPTGNRRWFPVSVLVCRPDELARDRDQIWAEAVQSFKAGEPWWIDADNPVTAEVRLAQNSRVVEDSLTPEVLECAEHFGEVCYAQIFEYLGIVPQHRQTYRLANILRHAGWVQGTKKRKEITLPAGAGLLIAGRTKPAHDRFWSKP